MKSRRSIERLAIANRGEVAMRIIRACEELGITPILLHSTADVSTWAYRAAPEKICIGEAATASSYLNIENVISGAKAAGADAIHPGFGFLSENSKFAERCEEENIIFVGPSAEVIQSFGDKISAKKLVQKVGGPLVPGYAGEDQRIEMLMSECKRIGFPVMVKATAGGGGRGLKVIRNENEMKEVIQSAVREAEMSFGSGRVFLEKYLENSKHIEVQVFGEANGRIRHLFERECSIQRRHQKIIEEATSPSLTPQLQREMLEFCISMAEAGGYRNAGTFEFLLNDNKFYFMEVNTRLQVEHTVTEQVLGVDLVKAQIQTAMGLPLSWDEHMEPRGHAIECRLYAENPYLGGVPSPGLISGIHLPQGPGRRFDIGVEEGDEISNHYDPMIAKIIVWDENRPRAIERMKSTLAETVIFGLHTNIPLLQQILRHKDFVDGSMTTQFMGQYFNGPIEKPILDQDEMKLVQKLYQEMGSTSVGESTPSTAAANPWVEWGRS